MHCLFWRLQLFPSLCIGAASGARSLCPSQLITVPSLGSPCPVVEAQHRAGRAHMDSWHISGCEMYWSSCLQRSGLLQIHCLSNCQQWPPLPHRFYPRNVSPLSYGFLFVCYGHPRSNALLCYGVSRAREFAHLGLGHLLRWLWETWLPPEQSFLHPASGTSQGTHTPHEQSPGFPQTSS